MSYTIQFSEGAARQMRALRGTDRAAVFDQSRRILSVNPALASQAKIKRLRGDVFPPYRLRVGELRIFYEVVEATKSVIIHGVVTKAQAETWLATLDEGFKHEDDPADQG